MFSRTKTLRDSLNHFQSLISSTYENEEARSISRIVFKEVLGYDTIKLILNENDLLPAPLFEQLDQIAYLLNQHKPIQYILGFEDFLGYRFSVNESVLIPRPETEELVMWIVENNKNANQLNILDIGTGSGCIAISLKKLIPNSNLSAIDISEEALNLARKNALALQTEMEFIQKDILQDSIEGRYDIIVSNPPYVLSSEKKDMRKNVLDYEPSTALFVPDNDPLVFYSRIVRLAEMHLNNRGQLYFEINESYANECIDLFKHELWEPAIVKNDMRGKARMLSAKLR